jgi:hypothetical protein
MIPEACGSGGEMPLKPTMVAAANSMRGGGWPREMKAAGVVMPLAAECGAMPRQGGGGVILQRRCTAARCRHEDRRNAGLWWRDAIHEEEKALLAGDRPCLL